jgi:hypothetical protein
MNDRISDVIARLKVDSDGLAFTGFIANAHVTHPPVLEEEIWHHVHAETSGKFADGHRIQTSWIIDIHVRGESIWVDTENGSRYGIASFAPLGWRYFSVLYRAYERLDPLPVGTPIFDLQPSLCRSEQAAATGGLKRIIERRLKRRLKESESNVGNLKPLRPIPKNSAYIKQMTEHARESIDTLKRNGVNIIKHDE